MSAKSVRNRRRRERERQQRREDEKTLRALADLGRPKLSYGVPTGRFRIDGPSFRFDSDKGELTVTVDTTGFTPSISTTGWRFPADPPSTPS